MCGPIQFLAVGVPGLEPGTSASQTQRASQLRHTPFAGCKYTIHPRADKAQLRRTDKKEPFVERGGTPQTALRWPNINIGDAHLRDVLGQASLSTDKSHHIPVHEPLHSIIRDAMTTILVQVA